MRTNRAITLLALAALAAGAMLAMRQPLTLDELDLRTIAHAERIAQLEMEIGKLEKELDQIRRDCCGKAPDSQASPEPNKGSIPVHKGDTYYLEITEIRALDRNESLLTEAKRIEDEVRNLEKRIESRKNRFGQDLTEAQRRALITEARKLREQAKSLRIQYENPSIVVSGSDAEGRTVSATVTGPDQRATRRLKPGQLAKVRGDVTVFGEDMIIIDNATILPHR